MVIGFSAIGLLGGLTLGFIRDLKCRILSPILFLLFLSPLWNSQTYLFYGHMLLPVFFFKLFIFFSIPRVFYLISQHGETIFKSQLLNFEMNFFFIFISFFLVNSLTSFIFLVEITSILILLMLISGTKLWLRTSAIYFILFWLSFIASLLLFTGLVFLMWYGLENLWSIPLITLFPPVTFSLPILGFFLPIFVKLALPPFVLWKPALFLHVSQISLQFYIIIYYTGIFSIVLYLLLTYFSVLMSAGTLTPLILVSLSLIVNQITYVTAINLFFLYSSLLNSIFILLLLLPIA